MSTGITGFESPASEYTQNTLDLNDLLIERPSSTFFGQANGTAMIYRGIFDSDILIIDRSLTAQQDNVVVAVVDGEFVCRILDIDNKRLIPANNMFQPTYFNQVDSITIEGVVTSSIRCHRHNNLIGVTQCSA